MPAYRAPWPWLIASVGLTLSLAVSPAPAWANDPPVDPPAVTATPAAPARLPGGLIGVPEVVGKPEAEARRILESAGLVVTYPNYQRPNDISDPTVYQATAPGAVLSQRPAPGEIVQPGTEVRLAIADPNDPRPTPAPAATRATLALPTPTAGESHWLFHATGGVALAVLGASTAAEGAEDADPDPDLPADPAIEAEAEVDPAEAGEDAAVEAADVDPFELGSDAAAAVPDPIPDRVRPDPLTLTLTGARRGQLSIPTRYQLDGSPYARANCGVASLGMILAGAGIDYPVSSLRLLANQVQPPRSYLDGLAWETLASVGARFGLTGRGLYAPGGYRRWTFEEIQAEILAGHPVITLVRYQMLPANWASTSESDHYIVITGYDESDFIYNDSAPFTGTGLGVRLNAADLLAAWDASSLPRSAMAIVVPDDPIVVADPAGAEDEVEATPADLVPHDPGEQAVDLPPLPVIVPATIDTLPMQSGPIAESAPAGESAPASANAAIAEPAVSDPAGAVVPPDPGPRTAAFRSSARGPRPPVTAPPTAAAEAAPAAPLSAGLGSLALIAVALAGWPRRRGVDRPDGPVRE